MPEVQVHRMFFHFSELPLSMRTLFTATLIVLGIGYVFAMIQIYEVHSGLDGKPGLTAEDIAIAYSGSKTATKLESAFAASRPARARGDGRVMTAARGVEGLSLSCRSLSYGVS
jgi:hypothetical protein